MTKITLISRFWKISPFSRDIISVNNDPNDNNLYIFGKILKRHLQWLKNKFEKAHLKEQRYFSGLLAV